MQCDTKRAANATSAAMKERRQCDGIAVFHATVSAIGAAFSVATIARLKRDAKCAMGRAKVSDLPRSARRAGRACNQRITSRLNSAAAAGPNAAPRRGAHDPHLHINA